MSQHGERKAGEKVVNPYTPAILVIPVDEDGDGDIGLYQLTLKFNRDQLIAGFKDAGGNLRIVQPTELTSTVVGNGMSIIYPSSPSFPSINTPRININLVS